MLQKDNFEFSVPCIQTSNYGSGRERYVWWCGGVQKWFFAVNSFHWKLCLRSPWIFGFMKGKRIRKRQFEFSVPWIWNPNEGSNRGRYVWWCGGVQKWFFAVNSFHWKNSSLKSYATAHTVIKKGFQLLQISKQNQNQANKEAWNNNTGKSLPEALIFASTNPQYDDRLLIELQV